MAKSLIEEKFGKYGIRITIIQNQYEKVYIDSLKPEIQDHCEGGSFISNLDDELITNSMFADKTLSCVIRNPEDVFRIVTQDDELSNCDKLLSTNSSSLSSLESLNEHPEETMSTTTSSKLVNNPDTCKRNIKDNSSSRKIQTDFPFYQYKENL